MGCGYGFNVVSMWMTVMVVALLVLSCSSQCLGVQQHVLPGGFPLPGGDGGDAAWFPDKDTMTYADVLPPKLWEAISTTLMRMEDDQVPPPVGDKVWYDVRQKPQHLAQQVMWSLWHSIVKYVWPLDSPPEAMEWWVRYTPGHDGCHLHYDRLEQHFLSTGDMVFPGMGSVMYITTGHQPTIVTGLACDAETPELRRCNVSSEDALKQSQSERGWHTLSSCGVNKCPPRTAVLSFPEANHWLTFTGNLLHAIAPLNVPVGSTSGRRITLLINYWPSIGGRETAQPSRAGEIDASFPILRDAALDLDVQPGESWQDAAERVLVNHVIKEQVLTVLNGSTPLSTGVASGEAGGGGTVSRGWSGRADAPLLWDWDAYREEREAASVSSSTLLRSLRTVTQGRDRQYGGLEYVEGDAVTKLCRLMRLLH